jgi:hypothetical protein
MVDAICDSPLGSVGAHVVLHALVGVLAWCEIFPMEETGDDFAPNPDHEQKMPVALRIGRNLLMA